MSRLHWASQQNAHTCNNVTRAQVGAVTCQTPRGKPPARHAAVRNRCVQVAVAVVHCRSLAQATSSKVSVVELRSHFFNATAWQRGAVDTLMSRPPVAFANMQELRSKVVPSHALCVVDGCRQWPGVARETAFLSAARVCVCNDRCACKHS
jgi:hypothetical protein